MEVCTEPRCVQVMVNERFGDHVDTVGVHIHPDDSERTWEALMAGVRSTMDAIEERWKAPK